MVRKFLAYSMVLNLNEFGYAPKGKADFYGNSYLKTSFLD